MITTKGQAIYGNNNWSTTITGVNTQYLDIIRQWPLQDGINSPIVTSRGPRRSASSGQTVITNLFPNGDNPIGKYIRFGKVPCSSSGH